MSEWKPKVGERVWEWDDFGPPRRKPGIVMAVGDQLAIVRWEARGEGCSNVASLHPSPVDPVAEVVLAWGQMAREARPLRCNAECGHPWCRLYAALDALRESQEQESR